MKYQDLKKLATPGPFEFVKDKNGWCDIVRSARSVVAGIKFLNFVATLPYYRNNEDIKRGQADAALIVHCVNNFDKALEALKRDANILLAVSDMDNNGIAYDRYCELLNLIAELEKVK